MFIEPLVDGFVNLAHASVSDELNDLKTFGDAIALGEGRRIRRRLFLICG